MSTQHRTSTDTLISALRILAAEIQSDDGVATMAIAEGADRIAELQSDLARVTAERDQAKYEAVSVRDTLHSEQAKATEEIRWRNAEIEHLERRRQFETDLVCAAITEANARGVSFGSAELCKRVDEQRALRARVAELENLLTGSRAMFDGSHSAHMQAEARVADLEKELAPLRELVGVDSRAASAISDIAHWTKLMNAWDENVQLKQRNAELVADVNALQANLAIARVELERASKHEACVANATGRVQWAHGYCGAALARAESATPKGGGK